MIVRASDLAAGTGAWARAVNAPPRPAPLAAPSLFDGAASAAGAAITADVGSGARGLNVDQHAARVLAFLREGESRGPR